MLFYLFGCVFIYGSFNSAFSSSGYTAASGTMICESMWKEEAVVISVLSWHTGLSSMT
jgi:hypothetical protein